ncbi:MAG TPA: hypothetical protein VNG89_00290, partial [Vicinamibacterales bacterium]|nr:hypothetical protein [Vicinamibacterales bacterium]
RFHQLTYAVDSREEVLRAADIFLESAGARLVLAPDWQPVVWTEAERKKGQAWGPKTIERFQTDGTPPIEQYTGPRRAGRHAARERATQSRSTRGTRP